MAEGKEGVFVNESNIIQLLEAEKGDYLVFIYDLETNRMTGALRGHNVEAFTTQLKELTEDTDTYYIMLQITDVYVPVAKN